MKKKIPFCLDEAIKTNDGKDNMNVNLQKFKRSQGQVHFPLAQGKCLEYTSIVNSFPIHNSSWEPTSMVNSQSTRTGQDQLPQRLFDHGPKLPLLTTQMHPGLFVKITGLVKLGVHRYSRIKPYEVQHMWIHHLFVLTLKHYLAI